VGLSRPAICICDARGSRLADRGFFFFLRKKKKIAKQEAGLESDRCQFGIELQCFDFVLLYASLLTNAFLDTWPVAKRLKKKKGKKRNFFEDTISNNYESDHHELENLRIF
jgi:DNA/RNA endonuclease G (NUC1)